MDPGGLLLGSRVIREAIPEVRSPGIEPETFILKVQGYIIHFSYRPASDRSSFVDAMVRPSEPVSLYSGPGSPRSKDQVCPSLTSYPSLIRALHCPPGSTNLPITAPPAIIVSHPPSSSPTLPSSYAPPAVSQGPSVSQRPAISQRRSVSQGRAVSQVTPARFLLLSGGLSAHGRVLITRTRPAEPTQRGGCLVPL